MSESGMRIPPISEAAIEAHLRFLASPLLEGRGAGTRGGRLAEEYIRAVFAANGLEPIPGIGYRQQVPMIGMEPTPDLRVSTPAGDAIVPAYTDDYVLEAGVPEPAVSVDADGLLFVGYGISAPEFGWDDYEGVDVTDRLLLIRVNDPGRPETPDFFEGRALTYYGRWTYKFEEAARRGAAGVLLIHTEESAGYGWNVVRTSNTGVQYGLAGPPEFPLQLRGWITESLARDLFMAAGCEYDDLMRESATPGFSARTLPLRVQATVESTLSEVVTANVLAVLPGTDASRQTEPVILMAHHDHLGMSEGPEGPIIYPGAYDNASGVALLLAIASAVAESGERYPRPLVFLASTAEESGLLGTDWYTRNPAWPLARTAAVLNIDGANLDGLTEDIAPLGTDRSSLGAIVREAAAVEGLEVSPEQHPERGMFFRQDHFPFARAGVPGVAFDHGLRYRNRPDGWGEARYREFVECHYHQPTDAFREDFDYSGAVQQGNVMLRTAITVACADDLPDWNADSAFRRPGVANTGAGKT